MKILDVPQSGSVAGTTSSRNRFGQYRRTRATPVNPATTFQGAARARLSTGAAGWRDLTDGDRATWASLGLSMLRTDSLGQSYDLTGIQAYVAVNSLRLAAGLAVATDAPVLTTPTALSTIEVTVDAGVSVAFTPTPMGAGESIFLFASPPRSAGRHFESDYRLIAVSALAQATPFDVTVEYNARLGTPATGQKVFVRAHRFDGFFLSGPIYGSGIGV